VNCEHEYHEVMGALRTMYSDMKHGLCDPPSRRACTRCAAERKVAKMVAEYKGPRIVFASQSDAEVKS
jgi:hypothetical protein